MKIQLMGINNFIGNIPYEGVEFVSSSHNNPDIVFSKSSWSNYINNMNYFHDHPNHVFLIDIPHIGRFTKKLFHVRNNYHVDNCINIPFDQIKNIMLSSLDFYKKNNIVPMFPGPLNHQLIHKPKAYWITDKLQKNNTFHNKAFWRGSFTHKSRKEFYKFYKNINDSRFQIEEFELNIYKKRQGSAEQFDSYMNELAHQDIAFILRGDKSWAFSFYDIIRAGCIPVMISSMNDFGWENILNDVDSYFLLFDIRTHTMDYIHTKVCELLDDKDRVLQMKANVRKLYKTFFNRQCDDTPWDFIFGKCLSIHKNNYDCSKVDDKFICPDVLELKGFSGKL